MLNIARSRLSDSGEHAKVKARKKLAGRKRGKGKARPIRGYTRSWSFKEMITASAAPSLPSFLPLYFCLRAFSIQRARLSRSLEQAMLNSIALTQWLTWFSLHYHTLIGSGLLCSHLVVAIHSCRPLSARMVFLMVNIP